MPKPIYRPLFLLSESEELELNLRKVVKNPFALTRVSDWADLKRALLSAPQTAVCFADAIVPVGADSGLAEGLREVAQEYPLIAVVACLRVRECSPDVLTSLRSWGVAEIFDVEKEMSPAAVERRLDLVKTLWAQRLFRRALPKSLSARGRILIESLADIAARGGYVSELGDLLGVSRGTITRWCTAAGVPEPRRAFAWIRLLVAADLLDDPSRSIESIARRSGFASAASLKSATKTFTDLTPSDLRKAGAFETVARLARAEFRATREAARQSRQHKNSWYN